MNALRDDLRAAISPGYFTERLGFDPDPWQQQLLASTSPRIIEVCGRQIGKSTITGLKAYRTGKMTPNSLILLISLSHRQSLLLFGKVLEAAQKDPDKGVVVHATQQEMHMRNGSKIIAAPGKDETIRGFSGVDLLVIDEAAYVPDKLYDAVAPMIAASQGQVILLSSPAGKDGFFWRIWDKGEGWERYRIKAKDCERIPKEFLEEQRLTTPDHVYRREYEAEFTEGLFSLVSYDDIQASLSLPVRAIDKVELVPDEEHDPLPKVEALSG